jgi:hypothetical protein
MRTIAVAILALAFTGSAAASPVVKTAFNAKLKQTILVDGRGHTLSLWTPDTGGQPVCVNDSTYRCDKHGRSTRGPAATGGTPTRNRATSSAGATQGCGTSSARSAR